MSTHLAPPPTVAALLQTTGAGHALAQWQTAAAPPAPAPDWVPTAPANYIVIGYFGTDPDQAAETFQTSPAAALTAQLTGPPQVHPASPPATNPNGPNGADV